MSKSELATIIALSMMYDFADKLFDDSIDCVIDLFDIIDYWDVINDDMECLAIEAQNRNKSIEAYLSDVDPLPFKSKLKYYEIESHAKAVQSIIENLGISREKAIKKWYTSESYKNFTDVFAEPKIGIDYAIKEVLES